MWWLASLLPVIAAGMPIAREEFLATLRLTPDARHGAELFDVCAGCHGRNGAGSTDRFVPAIAGQHFRVLVKQLVDYRHDKRWSIQMEHYADSHRLAGPQELVDLAAYIASLPRKPSNGTGSGEFVANGANVYLRVCASCHGPGGGGDATALTPRIAGQRYEYLLRQLYAAADGGRPNMDQAHARLVRGLDREDIVGVSDYLSRLLPLPEATGPHDAP